MYDPRPHIVEALRLVVSPIPLVGSSFQQRCGSLREVVSGLASVKHLERNCDVENAVFLPESSTWTRQRTGQPVNRKAYRVRFVRIPMPEPRANSRKASTSPWEVLEGDLPPPVTEIRNEKEDKTRSSG